MAERATWAVSHNPGVMTTVDVRHSMGALWWPGSGAMVKRVGRVPNGTAPLTVTATSPTPDGFVHVSPGYMVSMGTRSIAPYIQVLDAIKDINILSTPAHGSLTRWDLIIAQQNDESHSDADNTWTVKQFVGNPSASPSDPTVTGSPDYVVIARVVVPPTAAVNGILTGNITQLLTNFTVPAGGLLPVADQAARDALSGTRYDGMAVWRMDRDWIEVYDGTAFRVRGIAHCSSTADRDSAITDPYNGQLAFTTDTGTLWERQAGAWIRVVPSAVTDRQATGFGTTTSATYTSTLTGGTVAGKAFVAPPSGQVIIYNGVYMFNSGANATYCGIRVRTGNVVGSGSDVLADNDEHAIIDTDGQGKTHSKPFLLDSLTPGSSYNVQQRCRVDGGTGTFNRHSLVIAPA